MPTVNFTPPHFSTLVAHGRISGPKQVTAYHWLALHYLPALKRIANHQLAVFATQHPEGIAAEELNNNPAFGSPSQFNLLADPQTVYCQFMMVNHKVAGTAGIVLL